MKKNKCSIQGILSVCLACLAVFAGCSGFTEDTNMGEASDADIKLIESQFASARVTQVGKAQVDKSRDSVTIVYETFGGCLKTDNGAYAYNSDFYFAESRPFAYDFLGDTLVLSYTYTDNKNGSPQYMKFYLIGGKSGELNGVWKHLPCVMFNGEQICSNEMEDSFIQFNDGSVEFRVSENKTYDYMSSGFVQNLAMFMSGLENRIGFDLRGHAESLDNDLSSKGFTVQNKTNKNMKFVYKEHQYELNVDYVQIYDSASVTLSSEGLSCTAYLSERNDASLEVCREENADYLYENGKGSLGYRKDNSEEFASCVKGLLARKTNASSNDGTSNNDVLAAFASARMAYSGKDLVNETQDSLTIVAEQVGGCLKNGESFMYDPDFYYGDSNTYAYGFRGDTLTLIRPTVLYADGNGGFESTMTIFLVGGSSGKLDGIWKMLPCRLIDAKGEMSCLNDADEDFLKIDNGKVEFYIAELEDYDYMKSVFVEELFMFLDSQNSIQIETPFYGARNVESLAEDYGIIVQEKTNRSMKFTYEGHVFDLKLNYARFMDSVSVTLTSGNVICNAYNREIPNITQEQCREENAPNLNKMESGAYGIRKYNDTEFEDCINGILGRERND